MTGAVTSSTRTCHSFCHPVCSCSFAVSLALSFLWSLLLFASLLCLFVLALSCALSWLLVLALLWLLRLLPLVFLLFPFCRGGALLFPACGRVAQELIHLLVSKILCCQRQQDLQHLEQVRKLLAIFLVSSQRWPWVATAVGVYSCSMCVFCRYPLQQLVLHFELFVCIVHLELLHLLSRSSHRAPPRCCLSSGLYGPCMSSLHSSQ